MEAEYHPSSFFDSDLKDEEVSLKLGNKGSSFLLNCKCLKVNESDFTGKINDLIDNI